MKKGLILPIAVFVGLTAGVFVALDRFLVSTSIDDASLTASDDAGRETASSSAANDTAVVPSELTDEEKDSKNLLVSVSGVNEPPTESAGGSVSRPSEIEQSAVRSSSLDQDGARDERPQDSLDDSGELASLYSLIEAAARDDNPYEFSKRAERFIELLNENPALTEQVFRAYGSLADEKEKFALHNLLIMAGEAVDVETPLVDQIRAGAGEHDSSWYSLLADIGVRSRSSRDEILSYLPAIHGEAEMMSAIRSIVPQVIPENERKMVIESLSPYLNHPDERVRGAAVKTIGVWGSNEHATVIEHGLRDPSLDVRHAAAGAALRSNIRSEQIRLSLLSIMNNPNEHMDAREQAHYALTNYALEGEEYEGFYRFNQLLEHRGNHSHGGQGHTHDEGQEGQG